MIGLLFNALKKLVLAESHAARRLLLGLLLIAVALTGRNSSGLAKAADNPIVIENQQPGSSGWQLTLNSASDATGQIKGYASATSVNKGQSITFYVSVNPAQSYSIDVYRIGWYQGLGGRLLQHIGPFNGVQQAPCPSDPTTGLITCNWVPAYTLSVPRSWTSGIYLAVLTNAQSYQNYIIFVVRDDSRVAQLLYQQSVTTYQAYNNYPNDSTTGKSLYDFNSHGPATISGTSRAVKVSFDRPYSDAYWGGAGQFSAWELYFVRWLERSGYDVSYSTDVDTHANGSRLANYKGFLSVGHDEYWSKEMRDSAEQARDAGVNLAFFGADAAAWQVRFESSASGVANRVLVCYKDATKDPLQGTTTTVQWRQPPVNRPEQSLIGVRYASQTWNTGYVSYVVTKSSHWVYASTGFKDGDSVPGILGYETDHQWSTYPLPIHIGDTYTLLSQSSYTNYDGLADWANSSIYQALSGAWVFAAGTIGWSWGLDNYGNHSVADSRIQRTTANILNQFINSGTPVIIAAPSNLTATAPSANTVNLTWTDNSTNENNFVIERSPNGSSSWTILSSTLPPNALSYSDTNVNSLATYYYRVKATNGANSSGYSNIVSVTLGSAAPLAPPSSLPIYTDAVMNGWRNWSWSSTQNFSNASPVFSGGYSISFVVTAGWGALYLHNDMAIDISAYTMLHFAVQATRIGQKYGVALYDGNNVETKTVLLSNYGGDPPVGTFKVYDIPLADLIGTGKLITGVQIQDQSGASQPAVYIDEIEFR